MQAYSCRLLSGLQLSGQGVGIGIGIGIGVASSLGSADLESLYCCTPEKPKTNWTRESVKGAGRDRPGCDVVTFRKERNRRPEHASEKSNAPALT